MQYKTVKSKLKLTTNETNYLILLTRHSKNLYNQALYNVRQHFFNTNEYLTYNDNYHLLKDSINYKVLNSTQAQAVLRKVDEAMKAFFGSIKKKVKGVRLPRYLKKDALYPLIDRMVYKPNKNEYILPRSNLVKKVSNELVSFTKNINPKLINDLDIIDKLSLKIKTPKFLKNKAIKEITIKPSFDGKYFYINYVYLTNNDKKVLPKVLEENLMGIDFGYNNLAFCATSNNHLLIDGKYLKSLNQNYHRKMAHLSSKRLDQNKLTKRMINLINKRNNQMTYFINKAARLIIDFSLENKVSKIIIGYNDGFKDINLSKLFNQMSRSIPIARLRDRIIYLASLNYIDYEIVNESYTSKASFIDKDEMINTYFSGKRIKRGLYQAKDKTLINADLNAALNIIRKSKPEFEVGHRGLSTPSRTYLS